MGARFYTVYSEAHYIGGGMAKKVRIGWGNHPDNFVSETELAALVAEAIQYEADREADRLQRLDCEAGLCGHYTCTEGGTLGYWEGNDPRLYGNF